MRKRRYCCPLPQYTPFTVGTKPGKNPCLPAFGRAYDFPYGLKYAYNSPSNITITFATGSFPDGLVVQDTSIVTADISIPTVSGLALLQYVKMGIAGAAACQDGHYWCCS
jgi:hypothetical protein